jgi:hypothetical protein
MKPLLELNPVHKGIARVAKIVGTHDSRADIRVEGARRSCAQQSSVTFSMLRTAVMSNLSVKHSSGNSHALFAMVPAAV